MKHRVRVQVPVEKRGIFGRRKTVYEERTIVVDGRTYRRIQRTQKDKKSDDFLDEMEIMDVHSLCKEKEMNEEKVREVFADMIVLKDPQRSEYFSDLSIPSYMRDWLVMKFSDDNGCVQYKQISWYAYRCTSTILS